MHRIYMTTNLINGKKYVGRCSKDERWDSGYLGSGVFLKQAIKKYGKESFKREILQELPDAASLREAIDLEKEWLLKFDCKNSSDFYNASNDTGGMGAGDKHTDETKEKIRERMKDVYGDTGLPPKWRENVTNAAKGRIPWNKGLELAGSEFYSKRREPKKILYEDYLRIKELYESGMSASKIGLLFDTGHHVILGMIRRGGPSHSSNQGNKMTDEQKLKISESLKKFHKNKGRI
jgi:group I intron endonuclease